MTSARIHTNAAPMRPFARHDAWLRKRVEDRHTPLRDIVRLADGRPAYERKEPDHA